MVARARKGAPPFPSSAIARALLVVACAAVTARARAQVDPADGAVAVHLSGPDDPELRDAIRELLGRLHLQIAEAGAPEADGGAALAPLVAQVEVDLSSPTDAVVVVRSDAGEVLFRRAVPRDASASIVREEIAHEVQSAVESALLAARERATRPEPAPPSPPPVALPPAVEPPPAPIVVKERATTTAPSSFSLELTTLAGVGPIANDSGPVARIGLGGEVIAQKLPLRPSVGLAALYALPFDTAQIAPTDLSTRTSIASVRILPALELLHLKWLAGEIGVGAGFDVMTVAPQQNPSEEGYYVPSNALRTATTRIDPIFSAMVTLRVAVVPGVVFLLTGGIDVDPESRDYVLRGSTVTALLSFAALGVATFAVTGGCATDTIDLADLSAPDAGPDGAATAQPCNTTTDCAADYYCSLPACDAPAGTRGTCLLPPTACYDDGTPPVCGCDHVTYYNDCLRQKNSVSSSSRGPCEGAPQCGGPGNPACRSGALCAELNSGGPGSNACERPPLGSCWVLPDQCPATPPGWDFSRWDPCMPGDGGGCLDTCTAIYQGGLHRESTHHCQ